MSIDETIWDASEGQGFENKEIECICLVCGYTHFVPANLIAVEDTDEKGRDILSFPACSDCSGYLMTVKKGSERN